MRSHVVEVIRAPNTLPSSKNVLAGISILSLNVLLPNRIDGWWVKKMYNPSLGNIDYISAWSYRQKLLLQEIKNADADIVALQEVCAQSFESDFVEPLRELGYDNYLLYKKGRFRPLTLWQSKKCSLISQAQRDRVLITLFALEDSTKRQFVFVNAHLTAGTNQGGRRLRQTHDALNYCEKLWQQKEVQPRVIFCGDMNAEDNAAALHLLINGEVAAGFLEDGISVTSKNRTSPIGKFIDVATAPISTDQRPVPPPTMVVLELFSLLSVPDNENNLILSPAASAALTRAFRRFCTDEQESMSLEATENWLQAINGCLGRGTEYRTTLAILNKKYATDVSWEELPKDARFELADFLHVYTRGLRDIWGLPHDLNVFGEWPLVEASSISKISSIQNDQQPRLFMTRFDRIFSSQNNCRIIAVRDQISLQACPNADHASDHLSVGALIQLFGEDDDSS
mmetsp:Transcript_14930/g.22470  ORF Transcript_14930/g.22470 Transcript_14930/m.22470 type:complete len:455 (+) Transcript_14930:125-1489(+)|eukprot:CAMPEP_0197309120 /NCGR_PEP_ID=MMETSP0891-20130614/7674_1 /TAXON_ID=44058 ORGANISM="Aureoumbra lagunensis, Strain CCMP1510" /NCGR_SAMPLE_ID=MMETSP0891 /ASSEMBLY_ACC=CAM_ASM_000534 /LENGTH=454 /DNA_ID=CAMNT_0042794007 /DNA_START=20 /DNA_END=1384 /DNA_ORIENTATION=+